MLDNDQSYRLEKFKAMISLFKFISGTLILGIATTVIKYFHDERELQMKEFDSIGKYVQYALVADRERKKDFSQYFAMMSNHPDFVEKWKAYDKIVDNELQNWQAQQRMNYERLNELAVAQAIDSMKRLVNQTKLVPEQVVKIRQDSVARAVATIETEFDLADVNAKLLSVPTIVNVHQLPVENVQELARDPLARAIVDVLEQYGSYCFNSARIRDWGRKKNRTLGDYSYEQINNTLGRLVSAKVLVTGNCKNRELFQYNRDFTDLRLFR